MVPEQTASYALDRLASPRSLRRRRAAIALILCAAAWLSRCAARPAAPTVPGPVPPRTLRVKVGTGQDGAVRVVSMEEYVAGSLLAEVAYHDLGPQAARLMAQVQAIVARTYATASRGRHAKEGFDLCSTTHCQLYRPVAEWPSALQRLARDAASDTRGRIVVHAGRPIEALFHSDCGGRTSAADVVWGGPPPPYLLGVFDPFCRLDPPDDWQFRAKADSLRSAFNEDPRTRVGGWLDRVDILRIDDAGRVARVAIGGERTPIVRGEELRAVLAQRFGARSIRSARFDVHREGSEFVFQGSGFGHGVGLCQRGALAQAREGRPVEAILRHYYPTTSITPRM